MIGVNVNHTAYQLSVIGDGRILYAPCDTDDDGEDMDVEKLSQSWREAACNLWLVHSSEQKHAARVHKKASQLLQLFSVAHQLKQHARVLGSFDSRSAGVGAVEMRHRVEVGDVIAARVP